MAKGKGILEELADAPSELLEKTLEAGGKIAERLPGNQALKKVKNYWHILGPGLTTGAADDDPSGIATYSQTGAQYGFGLLWLAAFTFPLMAVIQEMCARIGLVTGRGLAANIRAHFPRSVLYITTTLLFAANAFNIGADLGAMAKGTQLLAPWLNFSWLVVGFAAVSLALQIFTSYARYAKYLKWLALILLAYVASALLAHLDWRQVAVHAVLPSLTFSRGQLFLICGILGTTISPYLFFWQTSQEVEEEILSGKTTLKERRVTTDQEITNMRTDVWSGMLLSNVVMFFIIAACAAVLFTHGITNITSAAQAAEALRPFAGNWTYFLFAIGIIGTGLLAIPVLAGSASYAISESFRWREGLYRPLKQAHAFYGVIIIAMAVGLLLNFVGLDPIKALIYSAVANGVIAPVVLLLIVLMSKNSRIMGERVNRPFTTYFGWAITLLMLAAGVAAIWSLI
ncbi:MAG TPA: divalent metal cation transporter [Candidatus Saccharimonadales bacterium]|nr:divalent metal cation transporter [Candidatus Saccharimonadales bacterium]